MENAKIGSPYLIFTQLQEDGLFPVAVIKNTAREVIDTINLESVGGGLYEKFFTFLTEGTHTVTFKNYKDYQRTIEDFFYEVTTESINVEDLLNMAERTAASVWNAKMQDYQQANSFGLNFQVMRQNTFAIIGELLSPTTGLSVIKSDVLNGTSSLSSKIDVVRADLLQVIPAVITSRDAIISQVDQNEQLIRSVSNQLTSVQQEIDQRLVTNDAKVFELKQLISTLQNNTTVRFIVPEKMEIPTTGDKTYQFHLRLYDETGRSRQPDFTPLITVKSLGTGATLRSGNMSEVVGQLGAYYYNYTLNNSSPIDVLLVESKVTEDGNIRFVPSVSEIVEFESDLQDINNKLTQANIKLDSSLQTMNSGSYGLQVLKTMSDVISNKIDIANSQCTSLAHAIDDLPKDVATSGDVATLLENISNSATLLQVQNLLYNMQSAIMGSSNRTITEVFQKIDFSSLLQKNDPRLANLDTPISSRGTLTAPDVWHYAQRTLTEISIPIEEFQKIWDYSLGALTMPGSVGKRISEYLDTKVSSRATAAQVQVGLDGVAQEVSVQHIIGQFQQENAQSAIDMRTLIDFLTVIRTKTNSIPLAPATESRVAYAEANLTNMIQNLALVASAIKAYTDRIPPAPAKEQTVLAVDDVLLRSDDPRLSNLDVKVSSRAVAIDTSSLAHKTDIASLQTAVLGACLENKNHIDNGFANALTMANLENKIYEVLVAIAKSENKIIAAIPQPQGTTLSAKAIWEYATRTLTSNFDISNLATKDDVKPVSHYEILMSTVFRPTTNDQELIVWPSKDGQRVVGSTCSVAVHSSNGDLVWQASLSQPNTGGVFRFIHELVVVEDQNYYVDIDIEVDGVVRTSKQPFFTVSV